MTYTTPLPPNLVYKKNKGVIMYCNFDVYDSYEMNTECTKIMAKYLYAAYKKILITSYTDEFVIPCNNVFVTKRGDRKSHLTNVYLSRWRFTSTIMLFANGIHLTNFRISDLQSYIKFLTHLK